MTLTQDVVRDLVPVYLAGEASADTRRLVEEFAARDPAIAREIETARGSTPLPPTPPLAPTAEKAALDATRQLLRARTSTLVVAILFTLLPLSFVFHGNRVTFFVLRDTPVIAAAWWLTAAIVWVCHIWVRRRLRVSGL
jgi:hypothetical protein